MKKGKIISLRLCLSIFARHYSRKMDWFNFKQVRMYYSVMKTIRKKIKMTPLQTRKFTDKVVSLVPSRQLKGRKLNISGVDCEFFEKDTPTDRILLHIHGGAFAFGSLDTHRGLLNYLFKQGNFDVISSEYSLTPEASYPVALNQIEAIYHYLRNTFPNKKIFLSGDSAGGNLATALTLRLLEKKAKLPDGVILLSPWLDLREESIARKFNNDRDSGFDADDLDEYAGLYADESLRHLATVSPIVVSDLTGFPPTLIQVATNELLYTDSEVFAINLSKSGVALKFSQEDNLFHSWQLFPDYFTPAKKSLNEVIDFVGSN